MGNKDTALVVGVGASHGLGAAAARRFAREGLLVVVAGRTAEKVERVAEEISASGGSAEAVTGDAAIEENAIRFVETAEAKGPLAIVLQNSGSNRQDPFLELAAADFETIWREHCLAGFLTGRESARRMVPRGSRNDFVYWWVRVATWLGTVRGVWGREGGTASCFAKHGA